MHALGIGLVARSVLKPFSQAEIGERVSQDVASMYKDQEVIAAPIDFHEAAARALKYNLDYKLKLMETALSRGCTMSRPTKCCRA